MSKGKLIVIEGASDGIGKSTQYEKLCQRLEKEKIKIVRHHFPSYGTEQAKLVENYLKGEYGHPSSLSPYFINSLYAIDRAVTWNTKLQKLYEEGYWIILDRYTTSSLIYQSALIEDITLKKEFIDYVTNFEYDKLGIGKPDQVIFLYAPLELITQLRRKRNQGMEEDIHEKDFDFMEKVYKNAMFLADYLQFEKVKCNKEDEMRSIEEIHEEVYQLVKKK